MGAELETEAAQLPTTGRRARARQRTWAELRAAALTELQEVGPSGLALRAVARRVGMSPAGLYRYVDSRDALLTALIADAFDDLADHLEAALGVGSSAPGDADAAVARPLPVVAEVVGPDRPVAERLIAVGLAYRAWAVAHPNEFGLLFGTPIPGYAAPAGGPTVRAMTRVGAALARPLVEASAAGRLRIHPELLTPPVRGPLGGMDPVLPPGTDPGLGPLLLLAWGRLHGQVSLEVFGHHAWLYPDGCEPLLRADLQRTLVDLGMVDDAG